MIRLFGWAKNALGNRREGALANPRAQQLHRTWSSPMLWGWMLPGGPWVLTLREDVLQVHQRRGGKLIIPLSAVSEIRVSKRFVLTGVSLRFDPQLQASELRLYAFGATSALSMRSAINTATIAHIARVVSGAAPALNAWILRLIKHLDLREDVSRTRADIDRALAAHPGPPLPLRCSWSGILGHRLAPLSRRKAATWCAFDGAPDEYLWRYVQEHEARLFRKRLESWKAAVKRHIRPGRWIPKGAAFRVSSACPAPSHPTRSWKEMFGDDSPEATLTRQFERYNKDHAARKVAELDGFFRTVEKNPLTPEQVQACICMDDAVMLIAAAGSGKTSTMVAKTGYALLEGLAKPEEILLLAFNRAAADELNVRVKDRLRDVPGIEGVTCKTFHSFGVEVIGEATGIKPRLARWINPDSPALEFREMEAILKHLEATRPTFAARLRLFRFVFARDIGRWNKRQPPDAFRDGKNGFRTRKGDVVKSSEERVIADWLYEHGIEYEYEPNYEHRTATATHSQYRPDFYYPQIGLYHEHFALDARGDPPDHFENYLEGVRWKRGVHAEFGTPFIETTSHELRRGTAFLKLEEALRAHGLDPVPGSAGKQQARPPVSVGEVIGLLRTFQRHVKNNSLSHEQLKQNLDRLPDDAFIYRMTLFLEIYREVSDEWQARLAQEDAIDFEDMLVRAADLIEDGSYKSRFKVILGDEFQDCSRARMRILKGLTEQGGGETHLCVVGDDWQSINRFAGADLSVMTGFAGEFPYSSQLPLTTTFRCPKKVCEVTSEFIQQNPAQVRKSVRTTNSSRHVPLSAWQCMTKDSMTGHLQATLERLCEQAKAGMIAPKRGRKIRVMLLGRYNSDCPAGLDIWQERFGAQLDITYGTIHSAKGLEADFVYVLNVNADGLGFPCKIKDDPILDIAMPLPEGFQDAEERRLLYVAMTRCIVHVRLYTTGGRPSAFIHELVASGAVELQREDGKKPKACPKCSSGFLERRKGQHGPFEGCNQWPVCNFTQPVQVNNPAPERLEMPAIRILESTP